MEPIDPEDVDGLAYDMGAKPFLILDIGSRYTKCGFAGESEPRHILPAPPPPPYIEEDITVNFQRKGGQPGEDSKVVESRTIERPPSYEEWQNVIWKHLIHIYNDMLQCNVEHFRVMLMEDLEWTTNKKRAIFNTLHRMGVPGVLPLPGPALAAYIVPQKSSLVIDIGWCASRAIVVYERNPVFRSYQCSPFGLERVVERFREILLDEDHPDVTSTVTPGKGPRLVPPKAAKEIIEDIPQETLARLCIPLLLAPDIKEPLPKDESPRKLRISVSNEQMRATFSIGVSPAARREAINALFLGADLPGDGPSLPEAAARAVMACDSAVRANAGRSGAVIFSGGGSEIPGLPARIVSEVRGVFSRDSKLAAIGSRLCLEGTDLRSPYSIRGWMGASALGASGIFDDVSEPLYDQWGRPIEPEMAGPEWGSLAHTPFYTEEFAGESDMPDWTNLQEFKARRERERKTHPKGRTSDLMVEIGGERASDGLVEPQPIIEEEAEDIDEGAVSDAEGLPPSGSPPAPTSVQGTN